MALLASLILASPGLSWRHRIRLLLWCLGLLALTDMVSVLLSLEYTKLWPTKTPRGIVVSSDYSSLKLILFDWLFGFFDLMGRGFFVLLLYLGAMAMTWGRGERPGLRAKVGRNEPCPCGSGLKAKRCYGG
jgi:hypothetical protein